MAPSRRKSASKKAAAEGARRQWKVGDVVVAKVKGFPAWPATVSEPEAWGYKSDKKVSALMKLLGEKLIYPPQANQRKGGFIGLAAATVGLTTDAAHHLEA